MTTTTAATSSAATTSGIAAQYATAHETHYTHKDLRKALDLYQDIVLDHPEAVEAAYSRSQIQNIVNSAVPKETLFEAQVRLAAEHLTNVSDA